MLGNYIWKFGNDILFFTMNCQETYVGKIAKNNNKILGSESFTWWLEWGTSYLYC